jgi:hypothetical protein
MQAAPIEGENRKTSPAAVPATTGNLQASIPEIDSTIRGNYQEVYRITDTQTESKVLGTITLAPDLKIVKDQQAISPNIAQPINLEAEKESFPHEETETSKPSARNQANKRSYYEESNSSDDSSISEEIHQEHQERIKRSFAEPVIARALPAVTLDGLLLVHEYSQFIEEKIFGQPIYSGEDRLVFLYDIWSPGFRKITKRTEFKLYESNNPNPCIQRYILNDLDAAKYRVPPGTKYYIRSVTISGTGESSQRSI